MTEISTEALRAGQHSLDRWLAFALAGFILIAGVSAWVHGEDQSVSPSSAPPAILLNLDRVKDRTPLSEADIDGYYGLLERARRTPTHTIREAATKLLEQRRLQSKKYHEFPAENFPLFADLLHEPEAYRGQPVFLRGHTLEIKQYAAEENPHGITTLYECSLFTDDSQSHPATVIFTEAPPGLPLGEKIVDGVAISGYFLKLRVYHARDEKSRVAPLILARTITWKRESTSTSLFSVVVPYSLYAAAMLVGLGWIMIRWNRRPLPRVGSTEPIDLSQLTLKE